MEKSRAKLLIRGRKQVKTTYRGLIFVFEPYLLFESKKGDILLHGYKLSGEYETQPPPHWCHLNLKDINDYQIIGNYAQPTPGYNPNSVQFFNILEQF